MPQTRKGVETPQEAPVQSKPDGARPAGLAGQAGEASVELPELSFEASLERLEGVVDRLERGDLELEASLEAFEEGVRLSARCSHQLAQAEERIETLTQEGGTWVSRPFASAEESAETNAAADREEAS
jgi:exodeoxyribonuclease VII small subunit